MTDISARSAGQYQGQPWATTIPQPGAPQPYPSYDQRQRFDPDVSIDPGVYVQPGPDWGGDPGINVDPPQGWGGDPRIFATPGVGGVPTLFPAPAEPVDAVGSLEAGEHVEHGAKSLIIPGLFGGLVAGAIKSSGAPAGLQSAVFARHMARSSIASVIGGAAMGVAVAATSPTDKDSLAARYAVAGGAIGLVSGAIMPTSMRGVSAVIGGAAWAAIGWSVGRNLESKAKADAAAAAAHVQPKPTSTPGFPTVSI